MPAPTRARRPDVCLLLEGTYPYVQGGVSAWVHALLEGLPDLAFSLVHIGADRAPDRVPLYQLPGNVTGLTDLFCQAPPGRCETRRTSGSRVLEALLGLHLGAEPDRDLLSDLAARDLTIGALLHDRAAWKVLQAIYERVAPDVAFLDFFWHFRAMHVPLLTLLEVTIAPAACYHALSTGYAGLLGAVASLRSGRPFVVTEHGIYAHEREVELAQTELEHAPQVGPAAQLRLFWSRFFHGLSRLAYAQAARIVTISAVNRRRQVQDGAPIDKTLIIPNGVDVPTATNDVPSSPRPLRVGFVGRVVPIKDVLTFIRACDLALARMPLEARIIGPCGEEPAYADKCRRLVEALGRSAAILFVDTLPPREIYPRLDVVVLTSLSEGQPIAILEAFAAGLPVVATDVGACRELVEGAGAADRALGPAGVVTRVASPEETAKAIVGLAGDRALCNRLGAAGRARVLGRYLRHDMLEAYRGVYATMVPP